MFHEIPTIMRCSKCKSEKIVAPCNEPKGDFRCLDCGHEQFRVLQKQYEAAGWTLKGESPVVIEI